MSDESSKVIADIKRLEEQISNLRLAVIVLTILVSLLYILMIFQLTTFLPLLAAVGIIILCLFLLANSCTKDNGAFVGT